MDYSPPGSSVHGILQARRLEWVAISFFRGSSQPRDRTRVSCIAGRHNEPPGKPSIRFSVYYIGSDGKESACSAGDSGLMPGWLRSPEKEWQAPPGFLLGESHGQRSLVGYSPQGCREMDERLTHVVVFSRFSPYPRPLRSSPFVDAGSVVFDLV